MLAEYEGEIQPTLSSYGANKSKPHRPRPISSYRTFQDQYHSDVVSRRKGVPASFLSEEGGVRVIECMARMPLVTSVVVSCRIVFSYIADFLLAFNNKKIILCPLQQGICVADPRKGIYLRRDVESRRNAGCRSRSFSSSCRPT